MYQRFIRGESGIALPLAMIMIMLIGVMGAGVLTFVTTDVRSMAQTNRGQQAFEVADAGVEAAKRQLTADDNFLTNYDGGTDDLPWSFYHPSAGMTVNMDQGSAKVTIQLVNASPASFRVISTGETKNAGGNVDARRKVEAIIQSNYEVNFPRAYLSRTDVEVGGSASLGVSIFALRNAVIDRAFQDVDDTVYRRWAETSGADSYPNIFNATPRGSMRVGVGALGNLSGGAVPLAGTRSYGKNTCPETVRNYYTDSPTVATCTQKIAFPFAISTEQQDRDQLNVLRQRALSQETSTNHLYMDSNPGNKVDDAGMSSRTCSTATTARSGNPAFITSWPSGSTFDTVRFYEFQTWSHCNAMQYTVTHTCGSTTAPKGVIVVENGDFIVEGSQGNVFNGAVIVRAYDASGASVRDRGRFWSAGNPCFRGYANSGGLMNFTGNISVAAVPELGTLRPFRGSMEEVSWRECYSQQIGQC